MDLSPEQARQSLADIDDAFHSLQHAIDRQAGRIVLAWGLAYFLGPLCMAIWPVAGIIPLQLFLMGAIGYMIFETSRRSVVQGRNSQLFGMAWGILYGFGMLWFFILMPFSQEDFSGNFSVHSRQMWAYGVTLAMFAYIVMGLWMGRVYLIIGAIVTASTVGALFLLDHAFWFFCGVIGGGAMILGGLYLLRRSRQKRV